MFFKESYVQEPLEKGFDGNLWKWEYPDYNKSYMVGRCYERDSSDFSLMYLMLKSHKCTEYKGKLDTKDFGNFIALLLNIIIYYCS